MAQNAAPDTQRDDCTLIEWSRLDRLAPIERARYYEKALEEIDNVLATANRDQRIAKIEEHLKELGTEEHLKVSCI